MNFCVSDIKEAFKDLNEALKQSNVVQSRIGPCYEIINLNLTIKNPLDRVLLLSRDTYPESYLAAQWIWYAQASQDTWIKRFHPTAWKRLAIGTKDINSNYGQYVWREGQFHHCLGLLKADRESRRAVIMFNRQEVCTSNTQDHICTTSLQFLIRSGKMHLIATMRSNELIFGFRTDVAFFTLLQEIMAAELDVGVGDYHHSVGSFHVAQDQLHGLESAVCSQWPKYKKGELSPLLQLSNFERSGIQFNLDEFSLTQHIKKLMSHYFL